jgi:hypothetical protein
MSTRHQMERRINLRLNMRLSAVIRYRDAGENRCLTATTRNLSFEGAFMEAGGISNLAGSIVRLELNTLAEAPLIIEALVARSRSDGLGLMFAYYSRDVFEQLASLLESAAKALYEPADSVPEASTAVTTMAGEIAQGAETAH